MYNVSWAWAGYAGAMTGLVGNLSTTNYCMFGLIANDAEQPPASQYLANVTGVFGNPTDIEGDAEFTNNTANNNQCCIPSWVNITQIPGSYNMTIDYFFGLSM